MRGIHERHFQLVDESAQPQDMSKDILKFYVESWSAHRLRYFVISDANSADIQQLAGLLKHAGNS
jgi:anti-sigma factor RsiW